MNRDQAVGYIEALVDGEGYVVGENNRGQREVVVEMCDPEPINKFKEALDLLGVRYKERGRAKREHRRRTYAVAVSSQQGLLALYQQVKFSIPEKQRRLEWALASYKVQPYNLS